MKTFPESLPRVTTVKTYFNVNSFSAGIPTVTNYYYFKFPADKAGRVLFAPGYSNYYGYNQVVLSAISTKFQVERLNTYNYYYPNGSMVGYNTYTFDANTKIDVELVDVAGNLVESSPKLTAFAGSNGKLSTSYSPEGGSGYIHLKRDDAGNLVANAKGIILKGAQYDSYNNLYSMNYTNNLNTAINNYMTDNYLLPNKGDKKIINFYYGSGESREKILY